ncbi:hypothetical protein Tcan_03791 [Toxocara canis]|uniref:Uncharacterized protein n=1 Tax=Toxocara canis TaxID=6265 RepID=A0A0B2VT38_TOXCA|nr:hypothetical protein Tcan_03791 [Toxocara canis]
MEAPSDDSQALTSSSRRDNISNAIPLEFAIGDLPMQPNENSSRVNADVRAHVPVGGKMCCTCVHGRSKADRGKTVKRVDAVHENGNVKRFSDSTEELFIPSMDNSRPEAVEDTAPTTTMLQRYSNNYDTPTTTVLQRYSNNYDTPTILQQLS